jgi:hypothetical protein
MSDDRRDSGETPRTDLDAAIDAVAREMTDAEPSGALRARVLDDIAQAAPRRAAAIPRWAWAGAGAAAVLAVASSVWIATRPADQVSESIRSVESRPAPRGVSPEPRPSTEPGAAVPAAETTRASRAAAPRTVKASAETRAEDSHHLPALAEIAPLNFARVDPEALQIADVEVASLTAMPSIDIPSLDIGSTDITTADPKKEK